MHLATNATLKTQNAKLASRGRKILQGAAPRTTFANMDGDALRSAASVRQAKRAGAGGPPRACAANYESHSAP
jgi:hypothetical protein